MKITDIAKKYCFDSMLFQSDRKQTGQNVVGAFGGRSLKGWTNGTKEQPYLGLGKGDYRKRMNENQGIDKLAAKKSNEKPAKVLNIKISKNSSGGYDGQVYYSKNGENDLVSPFGVYASGKWAFPFGRTSKLLSEQDKKMIEMKIKKLLAQKGFVVKDSAELENDGTESYVLECDYNGKKIKKTFAGYVDAQNNAYGFVDNGGKNVKVYKVVNGGKKQLVKKF